MPYTSQGYMTAADLTDHEALTDTGPSPDCPGHPDDLDKGNPFPVYCSRAEGCTDEADATFDYFDVYPVP